MKNFRTRFKDKTVVITGGSSGIGLATAHEFAALGSRLALIARRKELLQKAAEELRAKHPAVTVETYAADVTQNEQVEDVISRVVESMGGIDVIITSAGTAACGRFEDVSVEEQRQVMQVNYMGTVQVIKASLPHLRESEGYIGLVGSVAGYMGAIGYTGYAPSKFAVSALAECLRMEMKRHSIGITIVYPPDTDTPLYHYEQEHTLAETKLLSRNAKLLHPEEVAHKFVTGIIKGKFEVYCNMESKTVRLTRNLAPSLFFKIIDKISGV